MRKERQEVPVGLMRTAVPPPTPWRALGARAGGCSPIPGQLAAPCVMFSHLQWQNLAIVCHSERIPKISDCPKILVGGGGMACTHFYTEPFSNNESGYLIRASIK